MNSLDGDFAAAASSDATNVLVIAPPGCGKTELLAHRALQKTANLDEGRQILALTFSNKAKANLNARLVDVLGVEKKRRLIVIHNFHGHSAEIIRCHGATLGMATDFELPNDRTQRDIVDSVLDDIPERELENVRAQINAQLGAAKRGPFNDEQVLQRLHASNNPRAVIVEEIRQERGLLFYDDLLRHGQRLLRVPEIASLYQSHFAAVMVDEFQDLSPQQLDLVLRSSVESRTVVGDPLQGIYSWTGARPAENEKLLRRISGDPHSLGTSYRSSPHVLSLLGRVSSALGGQPISSAEPDQWFEGGVTAGFFFDTGAEEAEFVRTTSERIAELAPDATVGIICRSGWRRKPVDANFAAAGTGATRWDLAVDDPTILRRLHEAFEQLGGAPTLDQLRTHLLVATDVADSATLADIVEAVAQLEELVAESGSLSGALGRLRALEEEGASIPPGIHLLNAHLGKGQQFDWVFIPGFDEGNMPSFLARSRDDLREEMRVLLVMISRARHGVVMTGARSLVSKAGRPYPVKPSRWTDILSGGMTHLREKDLVEHIKHLYALND